MTPQLCSRYVFFYLILCSKYIVAFYIVKTTLKVCRRQEKCDVIVAICMFRITINSNPIIATIMTLMKTSARLDIDMESDRLIYNSLCSATESSVPLPHAQSSKNQLKPHTFMKSNTHHPEPSESQTVCDYKVSTRFLNKVKVRQYP